MIVFYGSFPPTTPWHSYALRAGPPAVLKHSHALRAGPPAVLKHSHALRAGPASKERVPFGKLRAGAKDDIIRFG